MIEGFLIHLFGTGGIGTWTAYKSPEPQPHWLATGEDLLPRGQYDSSDIVCNAYGPGYQNPDIIPPILETAMYMDWFPCFDPNTGHPGQFQGVSVGPNTQYDVEIFSNGNPKWYQIDKIAAILQPQQDSKSLANGNIINDHEVSQADVWSLDVNLSTLPTKIEYWYTTNYFAKFGFVVPIYSTDTVAVYGEPMWLNFKNQRFKFAQL
jgi:hypothetical protein